MPWTKLVADMENYSKEFNNMDGRVLSYQEAIREAIDQSMALDSNVIVLGEGVDTAGYIYDTTKDLSAKYGKGRVIETPIAEAAMTGVTLGASIAGLRPILIHMRNDFLLVSMDQIINHISHWKQMFGTDIPIVIRATIGKGWGSGAQHSQSFHALFSGFDGLRVIMPSTPYDAKGLLLSSIACNEPVIFLEHRWFYNDKGIVPKEPYLVELNKSVLRKEGKDITIIGMSIVNRDISKVIEYANREEIDVEWIDLISINPLDIDEICQSVKKTGKLLIVENGPCSCGISAEISARVSEICFNNLKAPIMRVGWPGSTVPSGTKLEEKFYPDIENIREKIHRLVNY